MSNMIDHIIDRRVLKRRLLRWQIIAIVAVLGVLGVLFAKGETLSVPAQAHVAVLDVVDVIVDDTERSDALHNILDDDNAEALIVRINSPGGTFVGGENLYRDLRAVSDEKPVVAVIGDLGTSAAYMAALGTDRIYVRQGSLTGSIGVILQTANIEGLLDKIGIQPETVKSGELKAQPNPVETFTPESREMIEAVIGDMYDIFLGIVAERRDSTKEAMQVYADGRVFTGRQALEVGLVDAFGGMNEARSWLNSEADVSIDLPAVNITPRAREERLLDLFSGMFGKTLFSERLNLDGFLALWHPQLSL